MRRFVSIVVNCVRPSLCLLTTAQLAQRSWEYCNDSYRLDLCVRFDSEVIVS